MFSYKDITHYEQNIPTSERIKRIRIVVIDDEKTTFPFSVLEEEGYSIDYWPDVKNLNKLEEGFYDIIILDIGGIGIELDEENEGIAVLKHLKKRNPAQIIVAYSGQSYESTKIPFFQLADQYVPKPTSAIIWKEILDDIIETKITISHYWNIMKQTLKETGVSNKSIKKIEANLIKAAKDERVNICGAIQNITGQLDNIATITTLCAKIIALCNL